MVKLTNRNFKKSGLNLDLLNEVDAAIWQIQSIFHDIKTEESYGCNDDDIKTISQYIKKYPYIFLTVYNHNDKIEITIEEKEWEICIKDYDDYQELINEDLEKILKKVNSFSLDKKPL